MRPSILGFFTVGMTTLSMLSVSCVLYSAGSGVKRVLVVLVVSNHHHHRQYNDLRQHHRRHHVVVVVIDPTPPTCCQQSPAPESCGSQQSLPPGGKERLHFVGIRPEVQARKGCW